jgi:hypothetical protein
MELNQTTLSPSGVLIAADFRDNLVIDCYDPVFADMRSTKLQHLRSVSSEDAVECLQVVASSSTRDLVASSMGAGISIVDASERFKCSSSSHRRLTCSLAARRDFQRST